MKISKIRILIRGGGDLGTGVAHRLFVSGFRPVISELSAPRMVRTSVSFGNAVYLGNMTVEGISAKLKESVPLDFSDYIPVIVDDNDSAIERYKPHVVIDARMLKKDPPRYLDSVMLSIGLGPSFVAGTHVNFVVETNRGINLGKIYRKGEAEKDTGIPGVVGGKGKERVLRALSGGRIERLIQPGTIVEEGQVVARIGIHDIRAPFRGIVRGLITEGLSVYEGEKIGDIDSRTDIDIYKISDKARAVGGGVLESFLSFFSEQININNIPEVSFE